MPTDRAAARRALYRQRRRKGLCTRCGEKSAGRARCRKCRGEESKAYRAKVGTPEPVEKPPALRLWQILDWVRSDSPAPPASAGPVETPKEPDPLALAPEIAERVRALRASYGVPVDDTEGDEFAAWGPGPGTGRLLILSER